MAGRAIFIFLQFFKVYCRALEKFVRFDTYKNTKKQRLFKEANTKLKTPFLVNLTKGFIS
jgi:hypothetical protein